MLQWGAAGDAHVAQVWAAMRALTCMDRPRPVRAGQTPSIPGLRYVPDYLDGDEHDQLLAAANSHGWQRSGERGVQVYGYSYNQAKGGIHRVDDIPDWASGLAARL